MENDDFEIILTVKELDKCCSFYQNLIPELKVSIASNFLMKFILPCGRILKIRTPDPVDPTDTTQKKVLNLQMQPDDIGQAAVFLMQHNFPFKIEGNVMQLNDPAENTLLITIDGKCDFDSLRKDEKTQIVQIP